MGSSVDDGEAWHAALQQGKDERRERDAVISRRERTDTGRRRPRSRFGNNDYVPPFRAARRNRPTGEREQAVQKQQAAWLDMKKKINGVINRINASNIRDCVVHLLRLNLIRGKGVFCKALMRAQLASSHFSDVYAALISVLNTRMPEVGELLVCRLIMQLKDGYASREKAICMASLRFLAHLFNQQVINELPLLEFTSTCLIDPSNGSTELAVLVIRECGHFLSEKSPQATEMVFSRLREVLHNNDIDYRTQVLVDDVMELRRTKFRTPAMLRRELDLVDDDDIIPHFLSLEDVGSSETKEELNSFSFDKNFDENESKYRAIRDVLLGDEAQPKQKKADAEKGEAEDAVKKEGDKDEVAEITEVAEIIENGGEQKKPVSPSRPEDMTESKLVDFRRLVYLKIMSAASYEECAHKLTKFMRDKKGMEGELCNMVIECCSQEKTFLRYYGLLGQRLCFLSEVYVSGFEENFAKIYATVHRYDTRKIRNIASFFSSLLATNALTWSLMMVVHLIEEETTASSRIFLKILFQEVAKSLGAAKLIDLFREDNTAKLLTTVLRRDEPKNTRFAINFFTSIGLGYLTEDLREYLKQMPKTSSKAVVVAKEDADDDSSSLSSSSLSSSSLSSSSGISDRDDPPTRQSDMEELRRERIEESSKSKRLDDSARESSPVREPAPAREYDVRRSWSPRNLVRDEEDARNLSRRSPRSRSGGPYRDDGIDSVGRRPPDARISARNGTRSLSSSDSRGRSRSPESRRYSRSYSRRSSSSPDVRRRSRSRDRPRRSGSYSRGGRSASNSSSEPRRRYRRSRSSSSSAGTRKRRASPRVDNREPRKERKIGSSSRYRKSYSSDSDYSSERRRRSSKVSGEA